MVATVTVVELNGAGKTPTEISSARYCTTDSYNPGLSYPIPIPGAGVTDRSYWKSWALNLAGTFTKINNVRFYTDGAVWETKTGITCKVAKRDSGDHGCPDANYQQATGTQGTSGYYVKDASNGHAYYKGQTVVPANVQDYTDASPLLIDSGDHTTTERTKHVVTQLEVAETASSQQLPQETFYIKYDEIS